MPCRSWGFLVDMKVNLYHHNIAPSFANIFSIKLGWKKQIIINCELDCLFFFMRYPDSFKNVSDVSELVPYSLP